MLFGVFAQYFFGITIFITSVFLILLVLVQRGRGGGLTGALGGPGGQSAFGTKAGDLFTRITVIVAAVWIFLCASAVYVLNPAPDADNSFGVTTDAEPVSRTGSMQSTSGAIEPGAPSATKEAPSVTPSATGTPAIGTPATPEANAPAAASTPAPNTPATSTPAAETPAASPAPSVPATDAPAPPASDAPAADAPAAPGASATSSTPEATSADPK